MFAILVTSCVSMFSSPFMVSKLNKSANKLSAEPIILILPLIVIVLT